MKGVKNREMVKSSQEEEREREREWRKKGRKKKDEEWAGGERCKRTKKKRRGHPKWDPNELLWLGGQ